MPADETPTRTIATAPATRPFPDSGTLPQSDSQAAGAAEQSVVDPSTRPTVAGYVIEAELGRGGMGVVYRATQTPLNRPVAVKMILSGEHAGAAERLRFLTEAEVIAGLAHPHIVAVYEYGTHAGLPFYSMELLTGGNLSDRLKAGPLPPADAARLIEQLADAVHAAHRQGVVHRDLKPANVLFAADGPPKVTDFGLARRATSDLTMTGAVMGTPSYMAPEQADGRTRDVGPETDVYALGAILYECLTGRPPFRGDSTAHTLELVRTQEPTPLRRPHPGVSRDLETVCLKCLQKEPRKRYPTAAELADDLRRLQAGEPVRARPVGSGERAIRWARRKPTLAGLLVSGVLLAVFIPAAAGVSALWWQAREQRDVNAGLLAEVRTEQGKTAEALGVAEVAKQKEADARERLERVSYGHRVELAFREWERNELALARELLNGCDPARRGWEWHYVRRLCDPYRLAFAGHTVAPRQIVYSPDGHWMVSADPTGEVKVWATDTGAVRYAGKLGVLTVPPVLSADGKRLAVGTADGVRVIDTTTRATIREAGPKANALALSADGKWLVTAGEPGVRVWAVEEPTAGPTELRAGDDPVALATAVAVSADGTQVAAGDPTHLLLWDRPAARLTARVARTAADPFPPGLGRAGSPPAGPKPVTALVYTPDARFVYAGEDCGGVSCHDGKTGGRIDGFFSFSGAVRAFATRADSGGMYIGGYPSGGVNVGEWQASDIGRWQGRSYNSITRIQGYNKSPAAFAVHPTRREYALVDADGWVKQFPMPVAARVGTAVGSHGTPRFVVQSAVIGPPRSFTPSPTGRWVAVWKAGGRAVEVWDTDTGRPTGPVVESDRPVAGVKLSDPGPEVEVVAAAADDPPGPGDVLTEAASRRVRLGGRTENGTPILAVQDAATQLPLLRLRISGHQVVRAWFTADRHRLCLITAYLNEHHVYVLDATPVPAPVGR